MTCVTRSYLASAAMAEARKRRRYAEYMAAHPEVVFVPFGVDLSGGVGPEAAELLRQWGARLAARERLVFGDGAALGHDYVLREVAWTFVHSVATDIGESITRQKGSVVRTGRGLRRGLRL